MGIKKDFRFRTEDGDPVSELPLALEVDYFRVAKDRYFVPISVKIPGSVMALVKKGGKQTTDLDFIGEVQHPVEMVRRDGLGVRSQRKTIGAADLEGDPAHRSVGMR